ncbi:ABC transporter substrate-binding protein [Rhodohalobacter sp. 614A]|uniref:ABC transporter substrate-binding protein n=1 Tax=Rhodohalobacter sp. 614A TaxID=2908649 RepID=UPI001F356EE7|nr:NrtA/SsuA/CpmA family ABC transporter substrate-binding protein [Rhodohalobacter sp. 614A]
MKDVRSKYHCQFWGGLLSVFFWLILTGCAQPNVDNTQELTPLQIGITSTYQGEAATYVALDRGFFQKNGLDVTLKSNPSGKVSLKDLFDGTVQIAHVAETEVLYSLLDTSYYSGESAPSFQIFADMVYSNKIQKIIARKDHGISEPVDMVGKKVALLEGTQLDYFLDSFLLEHQISNDEFETINMDPKEQVEAIKNGEIDVAVLWEPYASFAQNELGENATYLKTDLTYSTLWLSTTHASYAESHPEVLRSYLRSIKAAQDYIKRNPDYTQELLAQRTGTPVEVVKSLWSEIDFELSLSERMLTLLEDQGRWMIRNNYADRTIEDMQQFVNFRPMQDVHPRGITVVR